MGRHGRHNSMARLLGVWTLGAVLSCALWMVGTGEAAADPKAPGLRGEDESLVRSAAEAEEAADRVELDPRTEAFMARFRPEEDLRPEEMQGLEVTERTGERVPGELVLTDSRGRNLTLGSYFNDEGRPIILAMVYYDCPVACTAVLDKLFTALATLRYTPGEDYQVVVVSFNHQERPSHAALKQELALAKLNLTPTPEVRAGVAFHVTDAATARMLSDATGFPYRLLPNGEFSHPIAVKILTPDGTISRYVHGFGYPPMRLRLALLEASSGRIGSSIGDALLAMCFLYDPRSGAYTLQAFRVMQAGAVLSAIAVGGLILTLRVIEMLRRRAGLAPMPYRHAQKLARPRTA